MACEGGEGLPVPPESGHPKDPFVGNVSKCIPLPPDHPTDGGVKRGELQFDACFEGGEGDHSATLRCRTLAGISLATMSGCYTPTITHPLMQEIWVV